MRQKGKLAAWKEDKGFDFISPDAGGEQVFVYVIPDSFLTNRDPGLRSVVVPVCAWRQGTGSPRLWHDVIQGRALRAASCARLCREAPQAFAPGIPLNLFFLVIVSRIFGMQMSHYPELVRK